MVLSRRFIAFCLVGGLNTAFGYSVYAALLYAGLRHAWALLIATCAGVVFNFFSTGRLVFGNRDGSRLPRFVAVYAIVYVFNLALIELLLAEGFGPYVGGAISMPAATLVAYALQNRFVFLKAERN